MKFKRDDRYFSAAIYACLVILFVFCLFNIGTIWTYVKKLLTICNPLIYGFVIAFIFNPLMRFFENKCFGFVEKKKSNKKLRRILSLIATYIVFAILLTFVILIIVPHLISSYNDFQQNLGDYFNTSKDWVTKLFDPDADIGGIIKPILNRIDGEKLIESINKSLTNSYKLIQTVSPHIVSFITGVVNSLKNAFLAIILSIYFLYTKEKFIAQLKKIGYALFNKEKFEHGTGVISRTGVIFENFISGKLIDSLIVGIICYIMCTIMSIKLALIVAFIVGITNIIPFFGPFIGAIPSAFLILITQPSKCIIFIIGVIVLQQVDGNIIGPKIIGDSIGLSPVWVMISIICMTGVLGITGMFIGVPLFAALYMIVSDVVDGKLVSKGLPADTHEYYNEGDVILDDETKKKRSLNLIKFKKIHIKSRRK